MIKKYKTRNTENIINLFTVSQHNLVLSPFLVSTPLITRG